MSSWRFQSAWEVIVKHQRAGEKFLTCLFLQTWLASRNLAFVERSRGRKLLSGGKLGSGQLFGADVSIVLLGRLLGVLSRVLFWWWWTLAANWKK